MNLRGREEKMGTRQEGKEKRKGIEGRKDEKVLRKRKKGRENRLAGVRGRNRDGKSEEESMR